MKSRIAPTPSGYLHFGNAFNFLLTDRLVKAADGELVLRIDDMDAARMRDEYLENIFATLGQLGIQWDDGPHSIADLNNSWSQRRRLPQYQQHLKKLRKSGLVYACSCSRKEVAAASKNGVYPGTCREKELDMNKDGLAWRINTQGAGRIYLPAFRELANPSIDLERTMGDFVVRKKDGLPAYQLCSVSDDLTMGIDLVVRGEDLLDSSAAQLFLARVLGEEGWLNTVNLIHHPLLLDKEGNKLSKSAGAAAISSDSGSGLEKEVDYINDKIDQWVRQSNLKGI